MKHTTLLTLLCLLFLCACSASGASTQISSTAALVASTETPSMLIAVYVPQPDETPTTPIWDRAQVSCEGKSFNLWSTPGTYLYQRDGGAFLTVVLKPGEASPSWPMSGPDTLSVAGTEDVTTGLGTLRATHLAAGRDYSILTGRLDYIKGTFQRHEWYVCGYGLVKLVSSESGVKSPGNNAYSSREDLVLVSFTPQTSNEPRIRYILADIQLGNVAYYYRANIADEETAEALRRWDAGVRVMNGERFEDLMVNGRWHIVYAGTDKPANGMDISLSSDSKR